LDFWDVQIRIYEVLKTPLVPLVPLGTEGDN